MPILHRLLCVYRNHRYINYINLLLYLIAAPECPDGKVWKECGMDCGSSCTSEGYEQECINERCVDGCFCPEGTIPSLSFN